MANEPLTGARIPTDASAPLGGTQISNLGVDLGPFTVPRFASTAARDTAYANMVAAGKTMQVGMQCTVSGQRYIYTSAGWRNLDAGSHLGDAIGSNGSATTSMINVVTATVTIPSGLPSGTRIKVKGTVFVQTGTGVGAIIRAGEVGLSNTSRSINEGNQNGDLAVDHFESSLTAGSRTFYVGVQTTVAGTLQYRQGQISVDLV